MVTWLKIWSAPFALLFAWFVLSYHDWNFGTFVLSRDMHDQFLLTYAGVLGIEVGELPAFVAKAVVFDGTLIAAFIAFRKRAVLIPWLKTRLVPELQRFALQS